MTPAERLIAAADLLDKRAAEAAKQVSAYGPRDYYGGCTYSQIQCDGMGGEIGDYAATLPPEVGASLAAWLRSEAETLGGYLADGDKQVALADLLLAGAS